MEIAADRPTSAKPGIRSSRWPALLYAGALFTTLPVLWLHAVPVFTGTAFAEHSDHWWLVYAHTLGGVGMLGFGAAALYVGWTRRGSPPHRWLGYAYLAFGSVGAVLALALSLLATHAPRSLYVATGTLSVLWLAVAAMAWRAARNRRFDAHREWMIRSFVLTWTFVGCRLVSRVPLSEGFGPEAVTALIWINWVVPLVVCEFALQWPRGARLPAAP